MQLPPERILLPPWQMSNRKRCIPGHSNQRRQPTERNLHWTYRGSIYKTRYNNHTSSFRNPKHKHATELSKYIWQLKQSNIQYSIRWKILKKCKAYSNKTKRCNLCLHEKYIIIYHSKLNSLNSRNELVSTCRHRKKIPAL